MISPALMCLCPVISAPESLSECCFPAQERVSLFSGLRYVHRQTGPLPLSTHSDRTDEMQVRVDMAEEESSLL